MYIRVINGTASVYTLTDLRKDNPHIGFPPFIPNELLATLGIYPYTRPATPEYDFRVLRLVDGSFEQDLEGNWTMGYTVEPLPLDLASKNVRATRDLLLAETDWIVSKAYERGQPVPTEWAYYRQALRDVTDQAGFPYEIIWPTKP